MRSQPVTGLVTHRTPAAADECIGSRGTVSVLRVTTLKAAGPRVARLIDYYAGLAEDQQRRDGLARGPVDYYVDPDEPPGRWWGSGCDAVGLEGEVEPGQLRRILDARHPHIGQVLGRPFGDVSARGFDATFSAPKSVSVLWALSPDPWVRAEVLAAHDVAVRATLAWAEQHGALTRRGKDGVDQVDTRGLVVALFRQHSSRTADPQLHTHAIIWSKVQDPTGRWLALDARWLKYQQRSIGWVYDAALRVELSARLGVAWEPVVRGQADMSAYRSRCGCSRSALRRSRKSSLNSSAAGLTSMTATNPTPAPSPVSNATRSRTADRPSSSNGRPTDCGPNGWSGPTPPGSTL